MHGRIARVRKHEAIRTFLIMCRLQNAGVDIFTKVLTNAKVAACLPFGITDEQEQPVLYPDGSKLPRKHLIADPILIVILNLSTV